MAKASNIETFLALPDHEKAAAADRAAAAPGRSMTASERATWSKTQAGLKAKHAAKKRGRPKVGDGAKVIALSVERGLLKRADAYAKGKGMKRAELFARGLSLAMNETAAAEPDLDATPMPGRARRSINLG